MTLELPQEMRTIPLALGDAQLTGDITVPRGAEAIVSSRTAAARRA